ncbi:MAG: hypothetical protein QM538_05730 [Methylacidiphilales bacterium]|nr:hypothetical protein [Candidatus Methylacidiphilales bacterium]
MKRYFIMSITLALVGATGLVGAVVKPSDDSISYSVNVKNTHQRVIALKRYLINTTSTNDAFSGEYSYTVQDYVAQLLFTKQPDRGSLIQVTDPGSKQFNIINKIFKFQDDSVFTSLAEDKSELGKISSAKGVILTGLTIKRNETTVRRSSINCIYQTYTFHLVFEIIEVESGESIYRFTIPDKLKLLKATSNEETRCRTEGVETSDEEYLIQKRIKAIVQEIALELFPPKANFIVRFKRESSAQRGLFHRIFTQASVRFHQGNYKEACELWNQLRKMVAMQDLDLDFNLAVCLEVADESYAQATEAYEKLAEQRVRLGLDSDPLINTAIKRLSKVSKIVDQNDIQNDIQNDSHEDFIEEGVGE